MEMEIEELGMVLTGRIVRMCPLRGVFLGTAPCIGLCGSKETGVPSVNPALGRRGAFSEPGTGPQMQPLSSRSRI